MSTPESSNEGETIRQREEPLFILDHKPDWLELTIRAICGGLLGLLLATYIWYRTGLINDARSVGLLFATVVGASGYFAAKYGDSYWSGISNFFRRTP